MAENGITVVIPMAGLGTRLRPHTWSKPKQLLYLAGKTVLDHVLDSLKTLPDFEHAEIINIIGYLGDQIRNYVSQHYPELRATYVLQEEPQGQSHALKLAEEHLRGQLLVLFADTLIETDFSFLADEEAEAVAWVKPVPDPRRFGVAEVDEKGWVKRLVEKPSALDNNLVVVGCYYFRQAQPLLTAIDEQMRRGIRLKGEFFLADAVNILLSQGLRMRTQQVGIWLDAGTSDALLETNRYLLDHGRDNTSETLHRARVTVIPPVFIHPQAEVQDAVIGPYVSIAPRCRVERCVLSDAILEEGAVVREVVLHRTILGRRTTVSSSPRSLNVGDDSAVEM